jgi:hypothetical protein
MRRSKKSKPSFDVARTDLGESRVGWVYRSDAPPPGLAGSPSPTSPKLFSAAESPRQQTSRGWVETGIGVMALPFTLTIVAMMAPVLWLFAPRARQ